MKVSDAIAVSDISFCLQRIDNGDTDGIALAITKDKDEVDGNHQTMLYGQGAEEIVRHISRHLAA